MTAQEGMVDPALPLEALPEYALRATGTVRLVLVIDLSRFVDDVSAAVFRHIRGSEAFAAALRVMHPCAPFGVDDATTLIEQDAYKLRVFRSRLMFNHFFPTYRIAWDASMRERLAALGYADVGWWQRWTLRLRLTRNGLAVVTLDQPIDDLPLIACTEQVLELPGHGKKPANQDQWAIGMTILAAFLDAIDCKMTIPAGDQVHTIGFTTHPQAAHTLRLDRYVIYMLRRVECDGQVVMPEQLKREYAQPIASFMESALVECDGRRRFPLYSSSLARALMEADVSSWDEELCLFAGECALIYYPLVGKGLAYVGGPLGLDAHAYRAYWAGIVRGIEHLVAFRSEAQQVERRTTDLLGRVPGLTRKVSDGVLGADDVALIDHLAAGLSDIFDSLPDQRSMAVSASAFRADYVRRKFDVLMRELDVRETLDLVNTNVEQLDFFLSYYNDMRLQWQGQRTNIIGIALGMIVLFMAISSFLADTFNVIDRLNGQDGWPLFEWVLSVVGGLLLLGVLLWRGRALVRWLVHRGEVFDSRRRADAFHRIHNR